MHSLKIAKYYAEAETFNFSAINSIVTSRLGKFKVNSGEPLEWTVIDFACSRPWGMIGLCLIER